VTAGRRYLLGVTMVAAAALLLSFALRPPDRPGTRLALLIALVAQGPLGWWLVRAIGTERFLLVWAAGFAARVVVLAGSALIVVPTLGLALAPTLFTLVGVMTGCVLVEAMVVRPGRREPEVR
jgi:hypothetical protein